MDEDESIRLHLLRMLTIRQGAVQSLPDYGLPDLNDLTLSRAELIQQGCAAIKECIEKYEPRLRSVTVEHASEEELPFTMGLRIHATKIAPDGSQSPWQWALSISGAKVHRH
ncbi:MAG: type VI secretion system baseplate subunit TssE [Betaproteobacteria bacterium]|nr:type VI secretion system baseplate subunit TssE [Betaproteobacteria bacterium]